jgi:hypothetical protein
MNASSIVTKEIMWLNRSKILDLCIKKDKYNDILLSIVMSIENVIISGKTMENILREKIKKI